MFIKYHSNTANKKPSGKKCALCHQHKFYCEFRQYGSSRWPKYSETCKSCEKKAWINHWNSKK